MVGCLAAVVPWFPGGGGGSLFSDLYWLGGQHMVHFVGGGGAVCDGFFCYGGCKPLLGSQGPLRHTWGGGACGVSVCIRVPRAHAETTGRQKVLFKLHCKPGASCLEAP